MTTLPPAPEPVASPAAAAILQFADHCRREHRTSRRWSIVWKGLLGLYLCSLLVVGVVVSWEGLRAAWYPHAGIVTIEGALATTAPANADRLIQALRAAYQNPRMRALVLDIDSPGGSPVQAERVHDALLTLKQAHSAIPVVAIIGDLGASAAYAIAVAADTIYASKASLVGSIGVRLDSFGFTKAIGMAGIERRLYVAGEHKGALDMFSPVSKDERAHIAQTLAQVHRQFIAVVKAGRGARLADDPRLFSGLVWAGEDARRLGLIDALGDRRVALDALRLDLAVDYTPRTLVDTVSRGLGVSLGVALQDWLGGWALR